MDVVTIETPHLHIEGVSRAGHETWFRVREFNAAFDIGRCPDQLIATSDIFITHAHLDHAVGIPFYAGQRQLHRMTGGRVYVPADAADGMREIMTIYERITGASFAEGEGIGLAGGGVGGGGGGAGGGPPPGPPPGAAEADGGIGRGGRGEGG